MDPIEEMRQQVREELQGSVTIVGKLSWCSLGKTIGFFLKEACILFLGSLSIQN